MPIWAQPPLSCCAFWIDFDMRFAFNSIHSSVNCLVSYNCSMITVEIVNICYTYHWNRYVPRFKHWSRRYQSQDQVRSSTKIQYTWLFQSITKRLLMKKDITRLCYKFIRFNFCSAAYSWRFEYLVLMLPKYYHVTYNILCTFNVSHLSDQFPRIYKPYLNFEPINRQFTGVFTPEGNNYYCPG